LRYKPEDKLLKAYIEYEHGKHAAKLWIRLPKYQLFHLLATFHNEKELEQLRVIVRNKKK